MSVHVDSEIMNEAVNKLGEALRGIELDARQPLNACVFPPDDQYTGRFNDRKKSLKMLLDNIENNMERTQSQIREVISEFVAAEARNTAVASQIVSAGMARVRGASTYSNSSNATIATGNASTGINDTTVESQKPSDIGEVDKEEFDITLEGKVPAIQVETVIELIYGEDPNLSNDEKERIAEAILKINNTEILEGLEEDVANQIRSDIVKDYMDGKIELDGIEREELQQYIESQPSINVKFELNAAINNFDSLISDGYLTGEQIDSVIENNVQICTEEEFEKIYEEFLSTEGTNNEAYIHEGINKGNEEFNSTQTNATGVDVSANKESINQEFSSTEANAHAVEFFYNESEDKVYIKDTADSATITKAIISVLDENIVWDDETGQISYVGNAANADVSINSDI